MKKITFFVLIHLLILAACLHAQPCTPVFHTRNTALCPGQAIENYTLPGVYVDTFDLGRDCDSIRTLNLSIAPNLVNPPVTKWFHTGSNGNGGVLPGGSPDAKWQVATAIQGPYVPATVMQYIPGNYSRSPWPDCQWIAHEAGGNHTNTMYYYYRIDFKLGCQDSCGLAPDQENAFCLPLDILADNAVNEVYVNGVPQSGRMGGIIPTVNPFGHVGFQTQNKITISLCQNWQPGNNTLIVEVTSGPPTAGFLLHESRSLPKPELNASFEAGSFASSGSGSTDTVCIPHTHTFRNNSTYATAYLWNFGDGSPLSDQANPAHTFTKPGKHSVTLIAYRGNCQSDTARLTVLAEPYHQPQLTVNDQQVCSYNQPIALNVMVTNPRPGLHYSWLPLEGIIGDANSENIAVNPYISNRYTVKVWHDASKCDMPAYDSVYIQLAPGSLKQDLGEDIIFCKGQPWMATFEAHTFSANSEISWSTGSNAASINVLDSGLYWITVQDHICFGSDTIKVTQNQCACEIQVPNAFSPNQDGLNDIFFPVIESGCSIRNYRLQVFNRFGQKIFLSMQPQLGWKGLYNGIPVDSGVYFYELSFEGGTKAIPYSSKGDIVVIR